MPERDDKNLKEREYRDEQGNVHHHTHEYMERKGGESGGERGSEREEEENGGGENR